MNSTDIQLEDELSRTYVISKKVHHDQWGYRKASVYRVTGRHMLNVWRLMREELSLTSYTFENIAYHVLHCRLEPWNATEIVEYKLTPL